jgi:hypothetical protein
MPTLDAAQLTKWRSHPQIVQGYLYIHQPARLIRRRVNMPLTIGYPVSAITFDNPDSDPGNIADVQVNHRVRVSSSAGALKGWARIHKPISDPVMYIAPIGESEIDFDDNDILDVYDEYPIWTRIPYISSAGVLAKDYDILYSDQNENIPPVVNCNVAVDSLFVSGTPAVITVSFDATDSYCMAPGAVIDPAEPYTWDLKDGTRTVGTEFAPQITATFPAGVRYVDLTMKDDNESTSIKHILIPSFTGSDDPLLYKVKVDRRGGQLTNGWDASFTLLDSDVSDYPEGARVIYFEEERFGSGNGPIGDTCIKFDGFIVDETLIIEPLQDDVTINCRGPLGILQERPAFAQTITYSAAPTTWAEMVDLGWWKVIIYLLYWHSNVLELFNLERPPIYDGYDVNRLDSDIGTLYSQIDFLAKAVQARFTCDQRGNFYMRRFPLFLPSASRAALDTIVTLTSADWNEDGLNIEYRHADDVCWVRATAIVASQTLPITAVESIAPSITPSEGARLEQLDRQLVTGQTELNSRAGRYYAWLNSQRDGARTARRVTVPLNHRGDVFDPAWQEWVALTLSSTTNKRQVSWSGARFRIEAIESTYDHELGVSDDVLTLEEETNGASGTTVNIEVVDTTPPPDSDPPDVYEPPSEDYGPGTKSGLLVLGLYATTNVNRGVVYYSLDMTAGNWLPLMDGLPVQVDGWPGQLTDGFLNPFNTDEAFLIISNTNRPYSENPNGNGGVYRNRSWKTGAAWEVMVSNDAIDALLGTINWYIVSASTTIGAEGCIYLLVHYFVPDAQPFMYVIRITDYGETLEKSLPLKLYNTQRITPGGLWIGANNPNKVVVSGRLDLSTIRIGVWVSEWNNFTPTSGGFWYQKWLLSHAAQETFPVVPYLKWNGAENIGETEMYLVGLDDGVKQSTDSGMNFNDWVPDGECSVIDDYPTAGQFSVSSFQPEQRGFWLKNSNTLCISANGNPAVFTEKALPAAMTYVAWAGGYPAQDGQFYIGAPWYRKEYVLPTGSPVIMFSNDGADTFDDWTGNLWSYHATGHLGLIRISPDWLDT